MRKIIDLTGNRYGKLIVISFSYMKSNKSMWLCKCDCGGNKIVSRTNLKHHLTKSCGCIARQYQHKPKENHQSTHNLSKTSEYRTYHSMKNRCYNSNLKSYKNYGGRGITVCDRWLGENGFENFLADIGKRPSKGHSVDRIDNDGNYCPENCRWSTPVEQSNNRRTNTHININGEVKTLAQWSAMCNVKSSTIQRRILLGWSNDKLLIPSRVHPDY